MEIAYSTYGGAGPAVLRTAKAGDEGPTSEGLLQQLRSLGCTG
jgi:hypothetical protein